ncbi:hypothetical protein M0R45_021648 [Rubus argutus]|uniref:Uncharacterized protein n=1 Tax=Rubus argutus TaxID=59490 RepID=A0AAW1XDA1_RUBAR
MDVNNTEPQSKSNHQDFHPMDSDRRDTSTCGVLHSIGSDFTRMRIRANSNEQSPMRSEQTTSKTKEHGNTPTSRVQQEFQERVLHLVKEPILQYTKRQKSQAL